MSTVSLEQENDIVSVHQFDGRNASKWTPTFPIFPPEIHA